MRRVWKSKLDRVRKDESGYALIMSLFVLFIVALIGIALAVLGIQEYNLSARTKLMDQAYTIAEAGINRAAVEIKMQPSLTSFPTYPDGSTHVYGSDTEPQWETGSAQEFGKGTFTTQIWQSELLPTVGSMKVIVATGSITRNGRTAERTIETRIAASAGGDYDASFDYCIYNGMKDSRDTAWPLDPADPGRICLAGDFQVDGATPYPDPSLPENAGITPHYPKGAIYTRGDIDFRTQLASGVTIKGNTIAEDDIYFSNAFSVDGVGNGINISDGNVVAGLDGTGSASLELYSIALSGYTGENPIQVTGYLCAAEDVDITSTTFIDLGASDSISLGGIVAGGDVTVTATASASYIDDKGVSLGNIFAAGSTTIESNADAGVSFTQINSGRDAAGLGVRLRPYSSGSISGGGSIYSAGKCELLTTLDWSGSDIVVGAIRAGTDAATNAGGTGVDVQCRYDDVRIGNIYSYGKVNIEIYQSSWNVGVASVEAGTDSATGIDGTGVNINAGGFNVTVASQPGEYITSQGSVQVNAQSFIGAVGPVWSGNDINMTYTGLGVNMDDLTAYSDVDFWADVLYIGGVQIDRVKANANVEVSYRSWVGAFAMVYNNVVGIAAGGNILYENIMGLNLGLGAWAQAFPFADNPCDDTPNPVTSWTGSAYASDIFWSGGNVHIFSTIYGGMNFKGDIECAGDYVIDSGSPVWDSGKTFHEFNANLNGWTPGVTRPGLPGEYTGDQIVWQDVDDDGLQDGMGEGPSIDSDSLRVTPPIVDSDTLLEIAGLDTPTALIEPNWTYFETCAIQDDAAGGAGHILTDDDDDGMVELVWDADSIYSSKETVFCGDTWVNGSGETVYVDLYINKLDWQDSTPEAGAVFEGTIVCKGNVYISCANTSDWYLASGDTLNVVGGGNIEVTNSGITLLKEAKSHFHFWAVDDIKFSNNDFGLLGIDEFYGSFTAGNRVIYTSDTFWQNVKFSWSRWALDPVGWLPPFKVYTWKEI